MAMEPMDILGESHLPDDLFTNTDGFNWGLDTYPDLGMGMGVLDHETLGESKQAPNLPDGIVTNAYDENDLSFLSGDQIMFGDMGDIESLTKEAALVDLSWLDLAEQDLERLPKNPVDQSIPDLEEAWGVHRRTNGLALIPNVDLDEATYKASLLEDKKSNVSNTVIRDVVRQASRRVASGISFRDAALELARKLGPEVGRTRTQMAQIRDDEGLLGRVFIRASDYPGCASGKWTDAVKKQATTAAYVVAKKACEGCVHAQNGSCSLFKKKLVASVPWNKALQRYKPFLEATGRKIASDVPPKDALRQALAEAPVQVSKAGDVRPKHLVAADQIGAEEARAAFSAAPMPKVAKLDVTVRQATATLGRWRAAGMLSAEDVGRITATHGVTGRDMLQTGAKLISAAKQASYSGGLNAGKMGYAASREEAWSALNQAKDRSRQATLFLEEEQVRREKAASREGRRVAAIEQKAAAVRGQIDMGLCGRALVAYILRTFEAEDRGLAASILDPYIAKKGALAEPNFQAKAYSGLDNNVHVAPVDAKTAWAQLKARHIAAPLDLAERRKAQEQRRVTATLGRWVRDGILSKEAATRLSSSSAPTHEVLRVAAALIGRSRVAAYSGLVNDTRVPEVSPTEAWAMLEAAEDRARQASKALDAEASRREYLSSRVGKREVAIQQKVAKVVSVIERGVCGKPLMNFIRKIVARDEVDEVSALLDPILQRTGALETTPTKSRSYEGPRYERAPTEISKASSGPAYGEVDRLSRWARQQMSEGFAGEELSQLLSNRFAHSVRTAASDELNKLRTAHEGLAGHVYVDSEAYATKIGTGGCEKGALRHRANQIPAVLEMPRCATCSLRVARADGTPVCSIYNKVLIKSASQVVEDPEAYRKEMVRLADGTDADRTASLFANTYTNDFQLGVESELDNLIISDTPSNEDLGEIFFGGMEVE